MSKKITTTIGKLLDGALKENGENLNNIIALGIAHKDDREHPLVVFNVEKNINAALFFPYDTNINYESIPYFCAWTKNRIYIFQGQYSYSGDGAYDDYQTKIISAPLNPTTGDKVRHIDL